MCDKADLHFHFGTDCSSDKSIGYRGQHEFGDDAASVSFFDHIDLCAGSLNYKAVREIYVLAGLNSAEWTFDALEAHYKTLVKYINFEDKGMVLAYGCGSPAMTKRSKYPEDAYQMGKCL